MTAFSTLIVKLTKCVILVKVILVIFDFEKCFSRIKIVYINNIYYLYILSLELFFSSEIEFDQNDFDQNDTNQPHERSIVR